ncbi:SDR family oxidoreductase [Sphingosinicella soli]|uniref:NAD(P)-dependent dehydrogenase (Short-subunit alcohol dehydrogenase family) n=1 Tax=Sphingosinicella soli TaxID=333708 RepID=A0A7W7B229_9SPHN|nr:SDR family oxidoreductase [Sphingosinicella soli]MBB4631590.1 NAD(P)-dependent dehydrogenase (short-subunit alcohol dehydrogenase family) [Sphingosinicella soli]
MNDLSGGTRHVAVTAGAANIGLAIAHIFADGGWKVSICDVDRTAIDSACQARPEIAGHCVDVADADAVAAFAAAIGPVDVLINNAGVAGPIGDIETNTSDDWARCFAVNVQGAFHMVRAFVPAMKRAGAGAIINISTASAITGLPGRTAYVASKWAIEGMTRNLARELGPAGIRVNAIRPGFMDTERMRMLMARAAEARGVSVADVEAEALGFISLRTKIQPSEIGETALFLASDAARHITGQIIGVDGNCEWEG